MTSQFFLDYLENLNLKMRGQQRNIILFLDNAPVHPDVQLSNIKLVFFPANTTAGTQPLDAGIIKNFKLHYRKLRMSHLLGQLNGDAEQRVKLIDLGMAVTWIKTSWNTKEKATTVSNCFPHVGLGIQVDLDPVDDVVEELAFLADRFDIADPVLKEDLPSL
jgi:hypothetical protein